MTDQTGDQADSIGRRFKELRKLLGVTQPAFADKFELKLPSLKDWEGGKTIPGGEALTRLALGGVNVTWLLLGDGEPLIHGERKREAHADAMRELLLNDPEARRRQDARLKRIGEVTRAVISGVNDALQELQLTMPEDKKTELISTLMELYLDAGADPQRGTILRLVKSAA